jgi:hypothetical protein
MSAEGEDVKRRALFAEMARQMASPEGLESMMMEQAIMARVTKVRYDAYVKAGFTPEQAIQLCRT